MSENKKQTAVEWLISELYMFDDLPQSVKYKLIQAKAMEKEQMLDFGEFIIDELAPMAQNREWVKERYNYFKSE